MNKYTKRRTTISAVCFFSSQGFCVAAAAEGGFLQTGVIGNSLTLSLKPCQTSSYMQILYSNFFFERCQAVGKEKQNYSVEQLRPGRSETVLCNCGQETVGGYRFGMIQNM